MLVGVDLMALPNLGVLPSVYPIPSDLLPPDPAAKGLCQRVRGVFRSRVSVEGAPSDQEAFEDHKPSLSCFHPALLDIDQHEPTCIPAADYQTEF